MNEIVFSGPGNLTAYFTIRNIAGLIYNSNTQLFESEVNANQHYYAVAMVEQGTGSGYYLGTFPVAILAASTYNLIIWSQLGGTPLVTDTQLTAGPYYWSGSPTTSAQDWITLAYLKTYLGISVSTYDAQLSQLITQASATLNMSLKRTMTLSFYYEILDGTGFSFLKTYNYPIQNINTIIQGFQTNSATTYAGSYFVYNTEGTIRWQINSGEYGFCAGFQNYLITYSAGYNPIPQDLMLACCMYAQFLYFYSKKDPTITNKTVGDVVIAYGRALMGDFGSEIFAPIEAILSRYREIGVL